MIPFADPGRENTIIQNKLLAAMHDVITSGWYMLGPRVTQFEEEFAKFIGSSHCVSCGNGTDALMLALHSVGVKKDDEVIVPSHTAGATISAVHSIGAIPVFCDINPTTYCIDPSLIQSCISKRTKAIIPVHLYGHPADMESIVTIARDHNLKVVEDCAQAVGARIGGRSVGTYGDVAAFSFYPTKNLGATGDGGAICSNNLSVIESVQRCRQYGWKERYMSLEFGWNSRLDELQAAMLLVKLEHIREFNELRGKHAAHYSQALFGRNLILPQNQGEVTHAWHLYVIQTENRDSLVSNLSAKGIQIGIHYPTPCHQQPGHAQASRIGVALKNTEIVSSRILSLPMHPFLSSDEIEKVIEAVNVSTS